MAAKEAAAPNADGCVECARYNPTAHRPISNSTAVSNNRARRRWPKKRLQLRLDLTVGGLFADYGARNRQQDHKRGASENAQKNAKAAPVVGTLSLIQNRAARPKRRAALPH